MHRIRNIRFDIQFLVTAKFEWALFIHHFSADTEHYKRKQITPECTSLRYDDDALTTNTICNTTDSLMHRKSISYLRKLKSLSVANFGQLYNRAFDLNCGPKNGSTLHHDCRLICGQFEPLCSDIDYMVKESNLSSFGMYEKHDGRTRYRYFNLNAEWRARAIARSGIMFNGRHFAFEWLKKV